jgi:hypothetical protein
VYSIHTKYAPHVIPLTRQRIITSPVFKSGVSYITRNLADYRIRKYTI